MSITRSLYTSEDDYGNSLLFDMATSDATKTVDLTFDTLVFIKSGNMLIKDAPFGAALDIEVIHPVDGKLFDFGKKIPLLGTGIVPLDSEELADFPAGLILRLTIHNVDPGVAFKAAGRLELVRTYG